jgi:hypothetical protein
MTLSRARGYLLTIFILGFGMQTIAVILVYLKRAIAYGDLTDLLIQLLTVYSVQLAVILGGIFATKKRSSDSSLAPSAPLRAAMILAIIWNVLLLWRFVAFAHAAFDAAADDSVTSLSAYVSQISAASSFLVVGALAYFFSGKP